MSLGRAAMTTGLMHTDTAKKEAAEAVKTSNDQNATATVGCCRVCQENGARGTPNTKQMSTQPPRLQSAQRQRVIWEARQVTSETQTAGGGANGANCCRRVSERFLAE